MNNHFHSSGDHSKTESSPIANNESNNNENHPNQHDAFIAEKITEAKREFLKEYKETLKRRMLSA